jgi:hypothetical protein
MFCIPWTPGEFIQIKQLVSQSSGNPDKNLFNRVFRLRYTTGPLPLFLLLEQRKIYKHMLFGLVLAWAYIEYLYVERCLAYTEYARNDV